MSRGNRSKLKAVGAAEVAYLVCAGLLVAALFLGLRPGGELATNLSPMAARAEGPVDLSASPEREGGTEADSFLYCPLVLGKWFPSPPIIGSFTASPDTIDPGEATTLRWRIDSPVDRVTLEPGAGVVTRLDSYMFAPAKTTTYTLTAYNGYGSAQAQVTVIVRSPPQITSFTATPDSIDSGQSSVLAWSVSGPVDSLEIEPGVGDVTNQTSISVAPTEPTTYTLTATNAVGSSTAQVAVAIKSPPEITSFVANPAAIEYGESTELRWEISYPVHTLTLEPGVGDVTGQDSAVVSPTNTTVYTLTASNPNGTVSAQVTVDVDISMLPRELLVYDWDRPVTTSQSGFPRTAPKEAANGDWTGPVNFAEGTLHFRVEIHSQPVPQEMKIQFCFWQYDKTLENCGNKRLMTGNPGTVVTWQTNVQSMYMKDGLPIDWENPREICGVAIKNAAGDPVSDIQGWNWSGENPDEWYPLDWRFTVVVVAEDGGFSGWENYID